MAAWNKHRALRWAKFNPQACGCHTEEKCTLVTESTFNPGPWSLAREITGHLAAANHTPARNQQLRGDVIMFSANLKASKIVLFT